MRFMMIVKHAEKQGPPPKPLMDRGRDRGSSDVRAGKLRSEDVGRHCADRFKDGVIGSSGGYRYTPRG